MNRILLITLMAFLFITCKSNDKKSEKNVTSSESTQEHQLNISILLDLSDRIDPQKNPVAKENDIENIRAITEFFKENMKHLNAYNAKGKIRVFLNPPPTNPEINSIVSNLNIDCSGIDNKGRKEVFDTITELYTKNLENIYNETIATSDWIGSDIWRFFKDDVRDYCIDSNPNYRNILIIFTDGYLIHKFSKRSEGNRFSYLSQSNLREYRNQNWEQLIEKNDFGIIKERDDLNSLEVLVLEVKAQNLRDNFDEDILSFVWKKWFNEMNVSRYEVYRSDLPANTKTRIENFLN